MASSVFKKSIIKNDEITINKPTEVDSEIFRFFESYQNLNFHNRNSIINMFHKKKQNRKMNNINSNNSQNFNNFDENPEYSDRNKKFNFTNEQKGLDDNYFNDIENKRKAKLALLMSMNQFSSGKFCREINEYFSKIKKNEEEKIKKETVKDEDVKKTFERQKCVESFDNKDMTKIHEFSDKLSKMNSDYDFLQNKNKQQFNNIKLLNKNKLPKIVEENNDFYIRKKFKEDLNEDQLANLYYTVEEIEKQNNNFISGRKTKKIKKEEMKVLLNNRADNYMISNGTNFFSNNNGMNVQGTAKNSALKMKSIVINNMKSICKLSNKKINGKNINDSSGKNEKNKKTEKFDTQNLSD